MSPRFQRDGRVSRCHDSFEEGNLGRPRARPEIKSFPICSSESKEFARSVRRASIRFIADLEQWKCCAYRCRLYQLRSGTSARRYGSLPNVITSRPLVDELNLFRMEASCTQKQRHAFSLSPSRPRTRVFNLIFSESLSRGCVTARLTRKASRSDEKLSRNTLRF